MLIPGFCPGGPRLSCGPTLSTNQMRPWERLGASECLYMCQYGPEIDISSSFYCTSGKKTVENLKISPGQLAPCQEKRIKRQQTVSSAGCKVLVPNASFLLASMSSYCRFRPIECSYSQSVSVFVPQDKFRGSAIYSKERLLWYRCQNTLGESWLKARARESASCRSLPFPR